MTKQQQQKKKGIQIQTFAIFQECAMKINNHVRDDIEKKRMFVQRFKHVFMKMIDSLEEIVIT
jgi:hypothetical protein